MPTIFIAAFSQNWPSKETPIFPGKVIQPEAMDWLRVKFAGDQRSANFTAQGQEGENSGHSERQRE